MLSLIFCLLKVRNNSLIFILWVSIQILFNDTSILLGHFVLTPTERESDRRARRKEENRGSWGVGRATHIAETEEILSCPLPQPTPSTAGPYDQPTTFVDHFVSSPRESGKRDRTDGTHTYSERCDDKSTFYSLILITKNSLWICHLYDTVIKFLVPVIT